MKKTIEIPAAPTSIQHGPHRLSIAMECLFVLPKDTGKVVPCEDLIVVNGKKAAVTGVFFDNKLTYPQVHVRTTIADLEKALKHAKNQRQKFGSGYWVNLSPDLSFVFTCGRAKSRYKK